MDFSPLLDFDSADLKLQTPEQVARRMRVAPAFVRLCIDAGMPTRNSLVSAAQVFEWLLTNYPAFRKLAGMEPLPLKIKGIPEHTVRQSCAVLTVLQYCSTRASIDVYRQEIDRVCASVKKGLGLS